MINLKLLGIVFILFSGYANSAVVDINSRLGLSDDLSLQTINLNAGTYITQLIERVNFDPNAVDPDSWNAWGDGITLNCDSNGENCRKGWLNSFNMLSAELGDIQVGSNGNRFESNDLALSSAGSFQFTLSSAQDVTFYVKDSNYGDNFGGLTVSVTPVPEASTIAMMTLGLGVAGFFARRKS